MNKQAGTEFESLVATMHRLRAPGGCPWDAEQTHATLKPYAIEEAHELAAAIDHGDDASLRDELGDLLLQVIFHAELAAERSAFQIADVVEHLREKLVRRHPHVFADAVVASSDEVVTQWSRIKAEERNAAAGAPVTEGTLDSVPRSMPALLRAHRLGQRAGTVGFDWYDTAGVRRKIDEELGELERAETSGDPERIGEELGDLLFTLASYARHRKMNAEMILHSALDRFQDRFASMESEARAKGNTLESMDDQALDAAWQRVKQRA